MKTASLPALRVEPELRREAEAVLEAGESLSHLIEQAVRAQVQQRKCQAEFLTRALASRDNARRTGQYIPVDVVLERLGSTLQKAKKKRSSQ